MQFLMKSTSTSWSRNPRPVSTVTCSRSRFNFSLFHVAFEISKPKWFPQHPTQYSYNVQMRMGIAEAPGP